MIHLKRPLSDELLTLHLIHLFHTVIKSLESHVAQNVVIAPENYSKLVSCMESCEGIILSQNRFGVLRRARRMVIVLFSVYKNLTKQKMQKSILPSHQPGLCCRPCTVQMYGTSAPLSSILSSRLQFSSYSAANR